MTERPKERKQLSERFCSGCRNEDHKSCQQCGKNFCNDCIDRDKELFCVTQKTGVINKCRVCNNFNLHDLECQECDAVIFVDCSLCNPDSIGKDSSVYCNRCECRYCVNKHNDVIVFDKTENAYLCTDCKKV